MVAIRDRVHGRDIFLLRSHFPETESRNLKSLKGGYIEGSEQAHRRAKLELGEA